MKVAKEKNDIGGISYYVFPGDHGDLESRILAMLSLEERAILADATAYFEARLKECPDDLIRSFLAALAEGSFVQCEIHQSRLEPSLSSTYFVFDLPSHARIFVGARRRPLPEGLAPWLRPLYEHIGAIREQGWLEAGGFYFADDPDSLPPLSEFAPPPEIPVEQTAVFFDTLHGDSLGYLPDGRCVWYLHETESLHLVEDPEALLASILSMHLKGKRVVAPEPPNDLGWPDA